jgi:mRNA-degrading endonuclease RelE of RelBE toxin-antitoxin system
MKIIHTDDFKKHLEKLPSATVRSFFSQQTRFENNPRHPSLHTKKLKDLDGVYSFRIGKNHRALFFFTAEGNVTFFAVGHRKDIYR